MGEFFYLFLDTGRSRCQEVFIAMGGFPKKKAFHSILISMFSLAKFFILILTSPRKNLKVITKLFVEYLKKELLPHFPMDPLMSLDKKIKELHHEIKEYCKKHGVFFVSFSFLASVILQNILDYSYLMSTFLSSYEQSISKSSSDKLRFERSN